MKRYARPIAIAAILIVLGLNAGMYTGMILYGRASYGIFVTLQVADMLGLLILLSLLFRAPRHVWAKRALDQAIGQTPTATERKGLARTERMLAQVGADDYRARLLASFMRQVE